MKIAIELDDRDWGKIIRDIRHSLVRLATPGQRSDRRRIAQAIAAQRREGKQSK